MIPQCDSVAFVSSLFNFKNNVPKKIFTSFYVTRMHCVCLSVDKVRIIKVFWKGPEIFCELPEKIWTIQVRISESRLYWNFSFQDANAAGNSDQVILVGAASKGIIQREFQHNATVYKTPYAKNPFDAITDEEIEKYKKDITRKQKGDSYCKYCWREMNVLCNKCVKSINSAWKMNAYLMFPVFFVSAIKSKYKYSRLKSSK